MNNLIIVRGAGDLATGIIHRLNRCGFKVVALEIENPLAIRRKVAFSEAVHEKEVSVEGVSCRLCSDIDEIKRALDENKVALIVDPDGVYIERLKPKVVIDSILAKRNLGTNRNMADLTIGLGPGFYASKDVDIVIETMRGHNLGRIITKGEALKNTGIPGSINGVSKERVVYSTHCGTIRNLCDIGDIVKKDQVLTYIIDENGIEHPIKATIDGLLRGIIRDGAKVPKNLKILDIDPRLEELKNCYTISDKARCLGGSVVEAILSNIKII